MDQWMTVERLLTYCNLEKPEKNMIKLSKYFATASSNICDTNFSSVVAEGGAQRRRQTDD
jgi:hypothetical protein